MNEQFEKYFLGELSSGQKDDFFQQISDDPGLKSKFAKWQNVWALAMSSASENDNLNARKYLKDFRKGIHRKKIRGIVIGFSKYAAILVTGILISWAFLHNQQTTEKIVTVYQKLTVPAGQRAMLTLSDGTTVWVNAKSTLEYPGVFSGKTREVILNGEAYFNVAPDSKQPFIVNSGDFRTQVVGTQFNMFAYEGFFDVSLIEGQVKIYQSNTAGDTIVLNKMQRVFLTEGNLVRTQQIDMDDFLWKEGIYYFDDIPFPAIVEKLELYYDVRIHVSNKALMTRKFTGKFRQRDGIESVLKIIQMWYPFTFNKSEDGSNIYII